MVEISKNIKYVKLNDGVSFSLVRTNPKLTTNTKLMYNGKKMYMESYASSELLNRTTYKNVSVKQNSTFNKDIANFLAGSGSQAYNVYQNFSDTVISDSFDNQFENFYWCGAESINSSFYDETIGFVAPLYLREKLPNYFLIFRLDSPSNYNLNVDSKGNIIDSSFDFQTDILDKAVLIKTFDLREGSVLGNYIHNYVDQELFEFDKSMYVNFSNGEVTYYGINRTNGVLEKKVENFENELLKNDNPILKNDKWFTEGFERNGLIFPYIINIEFLFDDNNFKESYDFSRYIGVYCNNIEFGEFADFGELDYTQNNAIYYFEDNKKVFHRYIRDEYGIKIDGKNIEYFDESLITGFEKERITCYAEPLDINEGFINRAQYGIEILKPLDPGDWVGIEYDGCVECYFADDTNMSGGKKYDMLIGEYDDFRFSVVENSTLNDIAKSLAKSVNQNKNSKFEAKYSDNFVVFYAKREGEEYNSAKMLMEASLLYNRKISLPISNNIEFINGSNKPIENISDSDVVIPIDGEITSFGKYYIDNFDGACNIDINTKNDRCKNVFKIYYEESVFFGLDRYLKTNNGNGRKIRTNMMFIDADGKIDTKYRLVIVEDIPDENIGHKGYDVSVSSTYQVEILDIFKPNHGVFSWFPVKDFDFDIIFSTYGQYEAFSEECDRLSKKINYENWFNIKTNNGDSDSGLGDSYSEHNIELEQEVINEIKSFAKSPFYDEYGDSLETEYDYYLERLHPDLCLLSKTSPYISKWGYQDEQKDSCENPYRLNVSKMFGVSNFSANIFLIDCDENEHTHSMPYYMTLGSTNYLKDYQYLESDIDYINLNKHKEDSDSDEEIVFSDCVNYWIEMFKNTDEDMFSKFFSGKKYGKRFDRKYSRLLGGNKFHNPSTLFRGVKFEVVREYNGIEKKSSEYNDYKFSFIYIPVMIDSISFDNKVHFVKNDTFKFIVGIVFVNTLLGTFNHNIFSERDEKNGNVEKVNLDYFNKGFLYLSCKDKIKVENSSGVEGKYSLTLNITDDNTLNYLNREFEGVGSEIFDDIYGVEKSLDEKIFYLWKDGNINTNIIITKEKVVKNYEDIIGKLGEGFFNDEEYDETIEKIEEDGYEKTVETDDSGLKINWKKKIEQYDITVGGTKTFNNCGSMTCKMTPVNIVYENIVLTDVCDLDWQYVDETNKIGYKFNISKLQFKQQSIIRNILFNFGSSDSVVSLKIYDKSDKDNLIISISKPENQDSDSDFEDILNVNYEVGEIEIGEIEYKNDGKIEDLRMDIEIDDKFDTNFESTSLKQYFSIFDSLSMYNIAESINSKNNVKYYSTVEDNKYKVRVIEPDCIEIEDKYESYPVKLTENNMNVIGSVEIGEKMDVDNIGVKVINRYSGFYNPIFNDVLYFDDYNSNLELPYSNTNIDYEYKDVYGEFGVIKNVYYHKTNISRSDNILSVNPPVYPIINEYAIDCRDYNIFSSSWDDGYFTSQDDLSSKSVCRYIGSMKNGLCMFGSKYLNLPDNIFIDTLDNGSEWDENLIDDLYTEIMYKEINDRTVKYQLFLEKRLKRYLKDVLKDVFSKYINSNYSFEDKETIEDDVEQYVEKNLLKLYKVDSIYLYVKSDGLGLVNRKIENEYLRFMNENNEIKIKSGFPVESGVVIKSSNCIIEKLNDYDRCVTYNLKAGFKESFGFGVSFTRK